MPIFAQNLLVSNPKSDIDFALMSWLSTLYRRKEVNRVICEACCNDVGKWILLGGQCSLICVPEALVPIKNIAIKHRGIIRKNGSSFVSYGRKEKCMQSFG
jgi:hypothetical protein